MLHLAQRHLQTWGNAGTYGAICFCGQYFHYKPLFCGESQLADHLTTQGGAMLHYLPIDGAMIFWSLTEFSYRSVIKDGLDGFGYDRHVPEQRSYASALKEALYEVCGTPTTLIRPLKCDGKDDGFTVVQEHRGQDQNLYTTELIAKVTPDPKIKLAPFDERAQPILAAFNKQMGLLKPAAITSALVSIIHQLCGTSLHPCGRLYWIPECAIERWEHIRAVIEKAGHGGNNVVYIIRHHFDMDAIRAVRDAIINEVSGAAKVIGEEIMKDDLGSRALDNRRQQAKALHVKIKDYEQILNLGLESLHKAVDDTETAIAQATILAANVA